MGPSNQIFKNKFSRCFLFWYFVLDAGFCEPLIVLSGVKGSSKENWNYSPGVIITSAHLTMGPVLTPLSGHIAPLGHRVRTSLKRSQKLSSPNDSLTHIIEEPSAKECIAQGHADGQLETEPRPRCKSLVYQGGVERAQKWKSSRHDFEFCISNIPSLWP